VTGNNACLIDETPLQTIDRGGRCFDLRKAPVHRITLLEKLIAGIGRAASGLARLTRTDATPLCGLIDFFLSFA
jgi:hypothetical protein